MGLLWGNKVDQAIDSIAGTSLADDETPMEDQPTAQEVLISELQATIAEQNELMAQNNTPMKVGLVEPHLFNPQDHLDILTPLYGVFKGVETEYNYECRECYHEWSTTKQLDPDLCHECPNCGDLDQDGDDLRNGLTTSVSSSREPTEEELHLVAFGNTDRLHLPSFMRPDLKRVIGDHWAQLNGVETAMPLDWGQCNTLTPLPVKVTEEEEYEEDD